MELRQLSYFQAVADHRSFSAAARQLRIAQPAVSAQIKRLETELGTLLFERTTRRVELTPAGDLLLSRARRITGEVDGARADLADLSSVLRGQLRLGATPVLGSIDLPARLAEFHRNYPGVRLSLQTGLIHGLVGRLRAGELDIVLGPIHDDLDPSCVGRALMDERLVLLTPPGRRPAPSSLADVQADRFVCLPPDSGLQAILVAAAQAEGFTPTIAFETHSPQSIRELVAAGLGVALVAESVARGDGPQVDVHELTAAPPHPPIGLIRRRRHRLSPAARAWVNALEASP